MRRTIGGQVGVVALATAASAVTLFSAAPAAGQGCQPRWLTGPDQGVPGIDGIMNDGLSHDDGSGIAIYVGGNFNLAGNLPVRNLARLRGDAWEDVGGGLDGPVAAMAAYRGDLFVGGRFTLAGSEPAPALARWDGEQWHATGLPLGANEYVAALGEYLGDLLVSISPKSGTTIEFGLYRLDGSAWHRMGSDPQLRADSFVEIYGRLLGLTHYGRSQERRISLWGGDEWSPFGSLLGVADIGEHGGDLVACGDFRSFLGAVLNGVAKWDGDEWQPMGDGFPQLGAHTLTNHQGDLYVTAKRDGNFYGIFRWTGAAWEQVGADFGWNTASHSAGGTLLASFDTFLGRTGPRGVTRWDGSEWRAIGRGFDRVPEVLGLWGKSLVFAGRFKHAGPLDVNGMATWNGEHWSAIPSPGEVRDLVEFRGDLIAAGNLRLPGRPPGDPVARWDGATWVPLGNVPEGSVEALAIHDNLLVATGDFMRAGGVTVNHIAYWDGAVWFPVGSGLPDGGWRLSLWGEKLVAATRPQTPRLFAWDRVAWSPIPMLGPSFGQSVTSLIEYEGDLIAAGNIYDTGRDIWAVARYDGSEWQRFPGPRLYPGFNTKTAVFRGELLAGDINLELIGSPGVRGLLSWNGASWDLFGGGSEPGTNPGVQDLAVFREELIVAGSFRPTGVVSHLWSRWGCQRCYPDCDESTGPGVLDIFDFLCFQNRYAAGAPYACDCDRSSGPGTCDIFDFLCFQNAFAAGCP